MKNKNLLKKFLSYLLILLILTPHFASLAHSFHDHDYSHLEGVNINNLEHKCDTCYLFRNQINYIVATILIFSLIIFHKNIFVNKKYSISENKLYFFSLRAPPAF